MMVVPPVYTIQITVRCTFVNCDAFMLQLLGGAAAITAVFLDLMLVANPV